MKVDFSNARIQNRAVDAFSLPTYFTPKSKEQIIQQLSQIRSQYDAFLTNLVKTSTTARWNDYEDGNDISLLLLNPGYRTPTPHIKKCISDLEAFFTNINNAKSSLEKSKLSEAKASLSEASKNLNEAIYALSKALVYHDSILHDEDLVVVQKQLTQILTDITLFGTNIDELIENGIENTGVPIRWNYVDADKNVRLYDRLARETDEKATLYYKKDDSEKEYKAEMTVFELADGKKMVIDTSKQNFLHASYFLKNAKNNKSDYVVWFVPADDTGLLLDIGAADPVDYQKVVAKK